MSGSIVPDKPRQDAIGIDFVKAGTATLIAVKVGNSIAVITPGEAERASVDLWSSAGYARSMTAKDERQAILDKKPIRSRSAKKGSIPLTQ